MTTVHHYPQYLPLFATIHTIRDYLHYSGLFAIRSSLFAIRYSLFATICHSLFGSSRHPIALASYQCVPGSIPGPGVICGLSLLLILALPCSERFLSGYYGFTLSSKTNISKFQLDLDYIVKHFIMSLWLGSSRKHPLC